MPNASLGKIMFGAICLNIIVYPCFKCVLCKVNGKFCKYTGNVMCTHA